MLHGSLPRRDPHNRQCHHPVEGTRSGRILRPAHHAVPQNSRRLSFAYLPERIRQGCVNDLNVNRGGNVTDRRMMTAFCRRSPWNTNLNPSQKKGSPRLWRKSTCTVTLTHPRRPSLSAAIFLPSNRITNEPSACCASPSRINAPVEPPTAARKPKNCSRGSPTVTR